MQPVYERGQDRGLDRAAAQRDQRPAVRLRLRPPGLARRRAAVTNLERKRRWCSCSTRASTCSTGGWRPATAPRIALTGGGRRPQLRRAARPGAAATAAGLRALGLQPEQRVLMLMADSPQFVVVYLAAMRIGAIPVPVSTMLRADGLAELLRDSRARFLAVTREFGRGRPRRRRRGARADRRPGRRRAARPDAASRCTGSDELAAGPADESVYPTGRLARVLALHLGHHRDAKARDAPARRDPRSSARPTARQVLGITPGRPLPVGGQGLLRLRPGQLGAVPARRSGAAAVLEPAPSRPGRDRASARREYGATLFFAGPTFFANMLRADLPADALAGGPAGRLGRRGAAGRAVRAVDGALRRRHPRRHRHDRDAAHLPVQPAGRGPAGHHRASPCPATTCELLRRGRPRGPAGHAGHAVRARRVHGHRLLVALRRVAAGVPGRVAAHRRHLRPGRRRLLRLPRPHRRHAQGQRHLGQRRPRSRRGCSRTRRWPRRSSSPPRTPTGWRSRSPTCSPQPTARRRPRTS